MEHGENPSLTGYRPIHWRHAGKAGTSAYEVPVAPTITRPEFVRVRGEGLRGASATGAQLAMGNGLFDLNSRARNCRSGLEYGQGGH